MKTFFIYIIIVINLVILFSCDKDYKIEFVEDFLAEKKIDKKIQFIRFMDNKLDSNSITEKLNSLPQTYLEIKHSEEYIDNYEGIIEIVLRKYRVGSNIVNQSEEIFIFSENGNLKIDYDATFNTKHYKLDSLFGTCNDTVLEIRSLVSLGIEGRNNFKINNYPVINSLSDNLSNSNFYILDAELYKNIKMLFSDKNIKHLILLVRKVKDKNYNGNFFVLDSIVQKGWIKNKLAY